MRVSCSYIMIHDCKIYGACFMRLWWRNVSCEIASSWIRTLNPHVHEKKFNCELSPQLMSASMATHFRHKTQKRVSFLQVVKRPWRMVGCMQHEIDSLETWHASRLKDTEKASWLQHRSCSHAVITPASAAQCYHLGPQDCGARATGTKTKNRFNKHVYLWMKW